MTGDTGANVLVARHLAKRYDEVVALDGLELELRAGELVALVGHNGSGKSTFLQIVAGLLEPTQGWVHVAGNAGGSIAARGLVSYVPDEPVLYDDLSVWEHVEFVARLHGATSWRERADDLIARFDLSHRADGLPPSFSRGMRRKVSLILGFVRPFSLMLIDEPFVGLDAAGRKALVGLVLESVRAGACVVLATHELAALESVSRCLGLREGVLIYDGPPSPEVYRDVLDREP